MADTKFEILKTKKFAGHYFCNPYRIVPLIPIVSTLVKLKLDFFIN